MAAVAPVAATQGTRPAETAKKRCRVVVKKVHGKKKRVRVCKKVRTPPPPPPPPPPPDCAARTGTGIRITACVSIPGRASYSGLATGAGAVWVRSGLRFLRIDPGTNRAAAEITMPTSEAPSWVAVGEGGVWVSNYGANSVSRIDPATNAIAATIPVGAAPAGIATTPGAVWVANHHANSVSRIDPATNQVVATITVASGAPESGPQALAAAGPSVYLVGADAGEGRKLKRIDAGTNAVSVVRSLDGACGEIAAEEGAVWLATDLCEAGALSRVDPATGSIGLSSALGVPPFDVALGLGAVWVARPDGLARLDPATGAITGQISLAQASRTEASVAVGFDSVWFAGFGALVRAVPA